MQSPGKLRERCLEIRKSPIHGHGLFARRAIKRGGYIATIIGSKVIYKSYFHGQSNRYKDWIGVGKDTWIDPVDEFQYVNHSCNPSAGIKGSRTLKVYALRDIAKGEEVTIDYSTTEADEFFAFENMEPPHSRYRKFIGPIQTLLPEVYASYLPYIPDYFKRIYESRVLKRPLVASRVAV